MPRRTKIQILKDNRHQEIFDAVSTVVWVRWTLVDAPPDIIKLVATYTSEAELADAEDIRQMINALYILYHSFRRSFHPRAYLYPFNEVVKYQDHTFEIRNNLLGYLKSIIYREPDTHPLILRKCKKLFRFMNEHVERKDPYPVMNWEMSLNLHTPEYYNEL